MEMGWEWWDTIICCKRLREVENFSKIFILTMAHHLAAQFFAIPMNMNHSENWYQGCMIFILQAAAAAAFIGGGYMETLNFETEITKVCITSWAVFTNMFIFRGPLFAWCTYHLFPVIKTEGGIFYILYFVAVSGMSLLNVVFIKSAFERSFKYTIFLRKTKKAIKDDEKMPRDES